MPIRVVLAEDNLLIREGTTRLLDLRDEVEVVAACEGLDELLEAVERERPDVVVTDIRMPPAESDEGIAAAELLRERHPDIGVVVLSQFAEPRYALRLLERGSAGRAYLLKERIANVEQLLDAIEAVASGGSVVDQKIVDALVAATTRARAGRGLDELTPRERETLAQMAQGKSNAAIASALFLTERAVEKHINSVFRKLGVAFEEDVNRRVKAVLLYLAEQRT